MRNFVRFLRNAAGQLLNAEFLLSRSNHTGTQSMSSVAGVTEAFADVQTGLSGLADEITDGLAVKADRLNPSQIVGMQRLRVFDNANDAYGWFEITDGQALFYNFENLPVQETIGLTDLARLVSPVFAGTPAAPTPPAGDVSTRLATTAFVHTEIVSANATKQDQFNLNGGDNRFEVDRPVEGSLEFARLNFKSYSTPSGDDFGSVEIIANPQDGFYATLIGSSSNPIQTSFNLYSYGFYVNSSDVSADQAIFAEMSAANGISVEAYGIADSSERSVLGISKNGGYYDGPSTFPTALVNKQYVDTKSPATPYVATRWYMPEGYSGLNGTAVVAGRIHAIPWVVRRPVRIGALSARVLTGVSGANTQLAIYADSGQMRPGILLAATSSMSSAVSNTTISGSLVGGAVTLQAGVYWLAMMVDQSNVAFTGISENLSSLSGLVGFAQPNFQSTGRINQFLFVPGQTFGVWPDLSAAVWTEYMNGQTCLIAFQVAP